MAVGRARPRMSHCRVARVRPAATIATIATLVGVARGGVTVGTAVGASVTTGEGTVGSGTIPCGADAGRGGGGVTVGGRDDGGVAVAGTVQGARTRWPPTW